MALVDSEEDKFVAYLLKEYEVISKAHFEAKATSTAFFRYYLILMSAPFVAFALYDVRVVEDFHSIPDFAGFVVLIAGVIGHGMAWHHAELKIDATLYARVCNGLRRYFYFVGDMPAGLPVEAVRVLPTNTAFPEFTMWRSALSWVYAIFNGAYASFGVFVLSDALNAAILLFVSSMTLQQIGFMALARRKEQTWAQERSDRKPE